MNKYTIGLDYGTDSVRAVIVNTSNGDIISSSVFNYPRWKKGLYCNPSVNQFRQHPLDYIEGLEFTIKDAIKALDAEVVNNIAGITVDTTGSTPVAVDRDGVPLSLKKGFEDNPDAMFILWKDHTAVKEAADINSLARNWGGTDFTMYEGGIYSSEWFWSKILHVTRNNKLIADNAYSWVEHCDWIPAFLTGTTDPLKILRSRCAAGHKAMWHKTFGGLPDKKFLEKLHPSLAGLRDRLYTETFEADTPAGVISVEWAKKLGLRENVVIGTGAFDAHLGAVGGEIKPGELVKVMGTSTCDMIISPMPAGDEKLVAGICGQVEGSIVPGMLGLEAGQSAFGDVYAWFSNLLMWPFENIVKEIDGLDPAVSEYIITETGNRIISELSSRAANVKIEESSVIALDWLNGRRTPDANQELKGLIAGLTLGTDAPAIFRALVEATAFGARKINERFISEGVKIDSVIAIGGVAKKNPFVMQIVSDVLNMPIKIARSEQTCALGSAMAAAVAAGIHKDIPAAQKAMGSGFEKEYFPDKDSATKYERLYAMYSKLGKFAENEM